MGETETRPSLAELQQQAAEREESKKQELDEQRVARQIRLGHIEAPKETKKTKAKASE